MKLGNEISTKVCMKFCRLNLFEENFQSKIWIDEINIHSY